MFEQEKNISGLNYFKELILISLGKRDSFSQAPTAEEWKHLYAEAEKQALIGFLFSGIERLPADQRPPLDTLMQWLGQTELIKQQNALISRRAAELTQLFADGGFRSVVLKGQGAALLYPQPELRTPGDIDLWVDGSRENVLSFIKQQDWQLGETVFHHTDAKIFPDVDVEIHYWPSFAYSPLRWRRIKHWIRTHADTQFLNIDSIRGYAYPSIEFNVVYSLLHIYRHVLFEGIGFRQLLDYYFILQHTTIKERAAAISTIRSFGLERFTAAIMYIEQTIFALRYDYLLCKPDAEVGQLLLNEIDQFGNFGKYNQQLHEAHQKGRLRRYLSHIRRLFGMLRFYPAEVLCAPFWKAGHYLWRKSKGYV